MIDAQKRPRSRLRKLDRGAARGIFDEVRKQEMSIVGLLILLYVLGVIVLVAEIFLPSHGMLSIIGIGLLIAAVYQTFQHGGRGAGFAGVMGCMIFVPFLAYFSIKYWHRTPIGKRISPPNPVYAPGDSSVPVEEINNLIGRVGKAVSPLRPVGICDFSGRRVSCVAQFGWIDVGAIVQGVGMTGMNLAVVEQRSKEGAEAPPSAAVS